MATLQFSNNRERMAHTQAGRIPDILWKSWFEKGLDSRLLEFMQTTEQELIGRLGEFNLFQQSSASKYSAWIAIAYSHPNLSHDLLNRLSQHLKISKEEALFLACCWGNLNFLKDLIRQYKQEELRNFLRYQEYTSFFSAAGLGHLKILEYLEKKVTPDEFQLIIKKNEYSLFHFTAENGHLEVLQYLEEKVTPEELQLMIKASNYAAFRKTARGGHLEVLRYLEKNVTPKELQLMIKSKDYGAFRWAAKNGHLKVLHYLEKNVTPEEFQLMIKSKDYGAFRWAAKNGHLEVLRYLEKKVTPKEFQLMIKAKDYKAFRWAAEHGHLEVLHYLEKKVTPEELQMMIKEGNCEAFRRAAFNGDLKILKYLEEQLNPKSDLQLMIQANDYEAFRWAALNGHLEVLRYLEEKVTPEAFQLMIEANDYGAFRLAAAYRHLEVLQYLKKKATPEELPLMIKADNCEAFRRAALNGDLKILKYLEEQLNPKSDLQLMIQANDYEAFRWAAEKGHLEVLQYLEEKVTPEAFQLMIQADNYHAYRHAATGGHLGVLRYLEEKITPKDLQLMIKSYNYQAFREAAMMKHLSVTHYLLKDNGTLNYAELHDREVNSCVRPYIDSVLRALRNTKIQFEESHPNEGFDVSQEQAEHYFFCMRNLIRRNTAESRDEMVLLLSIPAVKRRIHIEVKRCQSNQFLHLVLTSESPEAEALLLTILAVRQFAAANNLDRNEVRNGLDVQALAQDREFSMRTKGRPLLMKLTSGKLKGELRDFALTHFTQCINSKNCSTLKSAWDKTILQKTLNDEEFKALKALDITKTLQTDFITYLITKYGEQFSGYAQFRKQVAEAFTMKQWWGLLEISEEQQFLKLLSPLETKQQDYANRGYAKVSQQMLALQECLQEYADNFYKIKPPKKEDIDDFKNKCFTAIHEHMPILQEHRHFMGAFFAAVKQFFVALKAALFGQLSRHGFFNNATDGSKILDELEAGISHSFSRMTG